ncbi:MAG: prepilin-type N-terminal cleavage/methylation domain-containing protein [Candidatus Hydrogenedentes bacterium]|nr:prepilin-type N-terminal cleavage/methylation domain-containing protein [Candidatus Hydrogenedentota bacterium]
MNTGIARSGFTLMEIMVALAILGGALIVILNTHYAALRASDQTRDLVVERNLLERALGQAEVDVLAGNLTGDGDFGKRFESYRYRYDAQPMGEEEGIGLYSVVVVLEGPAEPQEMSFLVFNTRRETGSGGVTGSRTSSSSSSRSATGGSSSGR